MTAKLLRVRTRTSIRNNVCYADMMLKTHTGVASDQEKC
jgi:hypothetical protein